MDKVVLFLREFLGKVAGVLKSRKFWAAIGASVVLATADVELAALVDGLVKIWMVYIGAVALEDGLSNR